jgi:hypothetical protein
MVLQLSCGPLSLHRELKLSKILDFLWEVCTVIFNVTDIICDIAVAYEFYRSGKTTFFLWSIALFMIAQACYASFFVILYKPQYSSARKLLTIWLCVLPLAQLVPFFFYITSFDFDWMNQLLRRFDLNNTGIRNTSNDGRKDELWLSIENKLR